MFCFAISDKTLNGCNSLQILIRFSRVKSSPRGWGSWDIRPGQWCWRSRQLAAGLKHPGKERSKEQEKEAWRCVSLGSLHNVHFNKIITWPTILRWLKCGSCSHRVLSFSLVKELNLQRPCSRSLKSGSERWGVERTTSLLHQGPVPYWAIAPFIYLALGALSF